MNVNKPVIQVAGVLNAQEALIAASAGATHLGFPFGLDYHPEDTTREEAASIISRLPQNIRPVLITYFDGAIEIESLMRLLGCETVQLHGPVEIHEIQKLRKLFPGIGIWKSLVIQPEKSSVAIREMEDFQAYVDAFITDTYDSETGASGATGRVHDWQVSRAIVEKSRKPVILAGGLNPGNVAAAVRAVRPAGVDAHTGLENEFGEKDRQLVKAFVENARRAFKDFSHPK